MKKSLLIFFLVFIIIQFFQPKPNTEENGTASYDQIAAENNIPENVQNILVNACYDCHSNNTHQYWYMRITPINYLIAHSIKEGKEHLNFSFIHELPAEKQIGKYEEIDEEVSEGKMPEKPYVMMHKRAKLSDEQRDVLVNWARNQQKAIYDASVQEAHSSGGENEQEHSKSEDDDKEE